MKEFMKELVAKEYEGTLVYTIEFDGDIIAEGNFIEYEIEKYDESICVREGIIDGSLYLYKDDEYKRFEDGWVCANGQKSIYLNIV